MIYILPGLCLISFWSAQDGQIFSEPLNTPASKPALKVYRSYAAYNLN